MSVNKKDGNFKVKGLNEERKDSAGSNGNPLEDKDIEKFETNIQILLDKVWKVSGIDIESIHFNYVDLGFTKQNFHSFVLYFKEKTWIHLFYDNDFDGKVNLNISEINPVPNPNSTLARVYTNWINYILMYIAGKLGSQSNGKVMVPRPFLLLFEKFLNRYWLTIKWISNPMVDYWSSFTIINTSTNAQESADEQESQIITTPPFYLVEDVTLSNHKNEEKVYTKEVNLKRLLREIEYLRKIANKHEKKEREEWEEWEESEKRNNLESITTTFSLAYERILNRDPQNNVKYTVIEVTPEFLNNPWVVWLFKCINEINSTEIKSEFIRHHIILIGTEMVDMDKDVLKKYTNLNYKNFAEVNKDREYRITGYLKEKFNNFIVPKWEKIDLVCIKCNSKVNWEMYDIYNRLGILLTSKLNVKKWFYTYSNEKGMTLKDEHGN